MSADNRSTHTDALATLGTIINAGEKRDAIHLGVEPIQAGRNLVRGAHVGIGPDGKAYVESKKIKAVGIVDPFLNEIVLVDQWFWLIVYPRQITSLRHVWEHPDFPDSRETGVSPTGRLINDQPALQNVPPTEEQRHAMGLLVNEPKAMAKQRMMDWCARYDVEVDTLIRHAIARTVDDCHYWVHQEDGGKFEGEYLYQGFWADFNTLQGTNEPDHGSFLSCSC